MNWTAAAAGDPHWRKRAACQSADPDLFVGPFGETEPEREQRETEAKKVCAGCQVAAECLDFALSMPTPDGVWGGCNADELLRARRNRWKNGRRLRARAGKVAA